MTPDLTELANETTKIALEAGEAIMKVYVGPFATNQKADRSPVTEADLAAEKIILKGLFAIAPEIPVVSEESAEQKGLPASAPKRFWLVDPLDGTKEFIARNGDFTVNIALIEDHRAILGIVLLPALNEIYRGWNSIAEASRNGAPFEKIRARQRPESGSVMAISRSHANKELVRVEELGETVVRTIVAGSSLKFCRLAEGNADLYPRFAPTMEWDTAAGQAVLEAAGGSVRTLEGTDLTYGKPGFRNPDFIARGRSPQKEHANP